MYDEVIKNINNSDIDNKKCIVVSGDNWHHGVIGIVSSKITEKYYKPSILLGIEDGLAKGSGRSIEGFDLHEALMNCNEYLEKCGGHSAAVGLSLKQENVEKFKEQLESYADEKITDELLIRKIEIDEEVEKSDLSLENIRELSMLEPFGEENEKPIFLYKNLKIVGIRTLSDGKHIKLSLQDENMFIDVIGFGMGDLANEYELGDKVDVVGNLEINSYNGRESIQILLKDMRKSIGNIK
jgi:single-stranded-DNA-specific exonuclease